MNKTASVSRYPGECEERPMRHACLLLVLVAVATAMLASAVSAAAPATGTESLGNRLLDDLPGGVAPAKPEAAKPPAAADRPAAVPNDAGEDIRPNPNNAPLDRVRRGMQSAEIQLGKRDTIARGGE